jgi:hypothetical protein
MSDYLGPEATVKVSLQPRAAAVAVGTAVTAGLDAMSKLLCKHHGQQQQQQQLVSNSP